MSSTFVVKANRSWMPNTSMFEMLLLDIAGRLERKGLYKLAEESRYPVGKFPYFSLEDWSVADFNAFVDCTLEKLAADIYSTDMLSQLEASDLFSIVSTIEVKTWMIIDERYKDYERYLPDCTIHLDDNHTWEAPGWLYDFVIEGIAAYGKLGSPRLIKYAMERRAAAGHTSFSVQDVEQASLPYMALAIYRVSRRYGYAFGASSTFELTDFIQGKMRELHSLCTELLADHLPDEHK